MILILGGTVLAAFDSGLRAVCNLCIIMQFFQAHPAVCQDVSALFGKEPS